MEDRFVLLWLESQKQKQMLRNHLRSFQTISEEAIELIEELRSLQNETASMQTQVEFLRAKIDATAERIGLNSIEG